MSIICLYENKFDYVNIPINHVVIKDSYSSYSYITPSEGFLLNNSFSTVVVPENYLYSFNSNQNTLITSNLLQISDLGTDEYRLIYNNSIVNIKPSTICPSLYDSRSNQIFIVDNTRNNVINLSTSLGIYKSNNKYNFMDISPFEFEFTRTYFSNEYDIVEPVCIYSNTGVLNGIQSTIGSVLNADFHLFTLQCTLSATESLLNLEYSSTNLIGPTSLSVSSTDSIIVLEQDLLFHDVVTPLFISGNAKLIPFYVQTFDRIKTD